jgi:hypothetical protein
MLTAVRSALPDRLEIVLFEGIPGMVGEVQSLLSASRSSSGRIDGSGLP